MHVEKPQVDYVFHQDGGGYDEKRYRPLQKSPSILKFGDKEFIVEPLSLDCPEGASLVYRQAECKETGETMAVFSHVRGRAFDLFSANSLHKRLRFTLQQEEFKMMPPGPVPTGLIGCKFGEKRVTDIGTMPIEQINPYTIRFFRFNVRGETLWSLLKEHIEKRPPNIFSIFELLIKAANLLQQLHDNDIVMVDFKEDNLMVTAEGEVYIVDLGHCTRKGELYKKFADAGKATVYVAPEAKTRSLEPEAVVADPSQDTYSFAQISRVWLSCVAEQFKAGELPASLQELLLFIGKEMLSQPAETRKPLSFLRANMESTLRELRELAPPVGLLL